MTRGAMRRKRASGQRGIPRAARRGGRGAPRERRDASDEKARSRTGRDPPPTGGAFYLAPSGWRRVRCGAFVACGENARPRASCRPSSCSWEPSRVEGGRVRERRRARACGVDGGGKVFFTIRRLFSRARAAEPQMRFFGGWDSEPSLFDRGLSHIRSVFIIGKCRNRMKSSLVFLRLLRFSQQRHPLRQSLSPRDVLRRVETVGSGFRLRGEAPAEGRAAPRVAAAGAAGRVRRPRARRRAAGVQVRAAARAIGRGDARRAVRGGREGRRAGRPAEGPAEQEQVEGRCDGGRAKPPVVVLPGTSSDRGSYTIGEFDTHR